VALLLSPTVRRAFDRLAQDLARVFDRRFVALVATGPATGVAFVSTIASGDLDALAVLTETWRHDRLDTPLLLTVDEFRRSADAFPVEYQALLDHHVVVAGAPPFEDLEIEREHLRRACETAAKGYLVYLRQGWVDAAGHDDRLATLIASWAERLRTVLMHVARLQGIDTAGDGARAGAVCAGLDVALVSEILAVDSSPPHARRLIGRLPECLAMADALWTFVDKWTK